MPTVTFKDCDFDRAEYSLRPRYRIREGSIASLLNYANRYAVARGGATAARNIGSTTETWNEVRPKSRREFLKAHEKRNPGKIEQAKNRVNQRLQYIARQMAEISGLSISEPEDQNEFHDLIHAYIDDLVSRTYYGKRIEEEILKKEAGSKGFTPPDAESEKKNIDGTIEGKTYSIKPNSFRHAPEFLHRLGTDIVIIYDGRKVSFDRSTCIVTVDYEIHTFP